MEPSNEPQHAVVRTDTGEVPVDLIVPDVGNGGAIVIGAEAQGPNDFSRRIGHRLAALGYLVAIPDYYRGEGPPDPDDYVNLDVVRGFIVHLDFRRATFDLVDTARWVREQSDVDARRVGVWGYCTGATLAMLAACLDPLTAAAVLFYPSQPRFPELTTKRPVQPVELLWALRCPALLFFGGADSVVPAVDVREAIDAMNATERGRAVVYPGVEHVFAGDIPARYAPAADADSWAQATQLLAAHLGVEP